MTEPRAANDPIRLLPGDGGELVEFTPEELAEMDMQTSPAYEKGWDHGCGAMAQRIRPLLNEWAEPYLVAHPEQAIETLRKIRRAIGG